MSDSIPFDADKHHYGPPCKYGHGFETGTTIRYNRNNHCVACEKEAYKNPNRKEKSIAERFWLRVNKTSDDECWLWQGSVNPNGYGYCGIEGQQWLAHRYAWVLSHGDFDRSLVVCHKCDVPLCVNPNHLFLGTRLDNNRDMFAKGRAYNPGMHGVAHPLARLTDGAVREIRAKYKTGKYTQKALAQEYGIKQPQVSTIVRGEGWRHLL